MFEHLQWKDGHMRLNDLFFRLEPHAKEGWTEGDEYFCLYKEKGLYDQYESLFAQHAGFRPRNIVEIGLWDGGSLALWSEIFLPSKIVGVDIRQDRADSDYFKRTSKSVLPSWDNEARRRNSGRAWHGSTPKLYENWLREMINFSVQHPFQGESLVFINAWNEWAEGAYLEPDIHWGAAYLNATARAIASSESRLQRLQSVLTWP